jgi:large subunit ribosomal protein L15
MTPNEHLVIMFHRFEHGVKLLGDGAADFKIPLHFEVSHASESARSAVEAAGGSVKFIYFNQRGLRAHLMVITTI